MNHSLIPAFPVRHVLRAATLPKSPRAFHLAVITRCLIALLFASGCVSKPAYEQVSSAAEVEREAHRRTHALLLEKEAKLKALEVEGRSPGVGQADAPTAVAAVCPESREKELTLALKAREAELTLEKKRSRDLDREKALLARTVSEKEAQLRNLREKESDEAAETSAMAARPGKPKDDERGTSSDAKEPEVPFAVDPMAPEPLPGEPTSADSNDGDSN